MFPQQAMMQAQRQMQHTSGQHTPSSGTPQPQLMRGAPNIARPITPQQQQQMDSVNSQMHTPGMLLRPPSIALL